MVQPTMAAEHPSISGDVHFLVRFLSRYLPSGLLLVLFRRPVHMLRQRHLLFLLQDRPKYPTRNSGRFPGLLGQVLPIPPTRRPLMSGHGGARQFLPRSPRSLVRQSVSDTLSLYSPTMELPKTGSSAQRYMKSHREFDITLDLSEHSPVSAPLNPRPFQATFPAATAAVNPCRRAPPGAKRLCRSAGNHICTSVV